MEYPYSRKSELFPYTADSWWRNRSEFIQGRAAIIEFLTRKWQKELEYRLIKELWAFDRARIAVRLCLRMARCGRSLVSFLRKRELNLAPTV